MKWCKNGVVGDKNRKWGRKKPINMKVLRDMEQYKKELIDFIYEEIRKAPSTILDTLKKIDKK